VSRAAASVDARPAGAPRAGRPIPVLLVIATLGVCALVALPLVYLLVRSSAATDSSWNLILRDRTVWLALRTLGLAAAVTTAAVAIGVPLAWLAVRSDLPMRRMWATLFALPLVFPSYVGAFALLSALGPRGMLQGLLEAPFGVQRLPDISGFAGAFLALTLFTYPYVYLLVAAALRSFDPSFEEASRTLGRSRTSTFRRVTLPLLRPSIAAGGLLVALYAIHDFGAVSIMRFPTFTQAIFLQYRAAFDRTPAAILSLMLVAIAVVVVLAERRASGRARYYRTGAGTPRPLRPSALGPLRWPAIAFSSAIVGLALVLPASVLVYWLARGIAAGIPANVTISAAGGSVMASAAGATVTLVLAVPLAIVAARYPGRLDVVARGASYSGYALPGLVVALSLVFFAASYAPVMYQTLALVTVAYVILFLPQATEPLRGALLQLNPRIEEAGRVLGRSRLAVARRIVLPLVSGPVFAALALVFLTAMKELPATLLLRPTGFETLATRIWTSASAGLYSRAALPALILVAVSAVPAWLLARRLEVPRGGPA
jgi:iron(III) transport system permease protein